MTFILPAQPTKSGLPPAERAPSSFSDRVAAGLEAERIETDSWSRSWRIEGQVLGELEAELGLDPRPQGGRPTNTPHPLREPRVARVLEEAAKRRAGVSDRRSQDAADRLPATADDFNRMVLERREAEYREAQTVLQAAPADAFGAETLGRLYGGATDPVAIAMLPLGGVATAPLKVAATEFGLGVFGEALTLERQFEVADELGLPPPSVAAQLTIAGLTAGAIGGGLAFGVERFKGYRAARGEADATQRGQRDTIDHEAAVRRAGETLEGDTPGLSLGDFDFSPEGNASPTDNRIGYVFGRLLAEGIEPHIAAGIVGNGMVESGIALDARAIGDGGNALGMWQWNGPRRHALEAFAAREGKPATDLDTQIAFLLHELNGPEAAAWAQVRGATTAAEAAMLFSRHFERPGIPHNARRVAHAEGIQEQYDAGQVPKWTGPRAASSSSDAGDFTPYRTSRGYTREGQVSYGDNQRIDVEYQVVDLATLRQASGDLQPRDRSRAASDAWVSETAAALDPAQLMPAPTADRGAPIVGPDNIIESGNGRVRAIERAYQVAPDRAAAYRAQIEALTGEPVPEGVDRPVLVARRTSALEDAARRRFVEEAQDSGVARMTATERARIGRNRLDADMLAKFVPGKRLASAENREFARDFIAGFPRSERNAFIGEDGSLSQDGVRQVQDSLFARAWDDPAVIAMRTEAEPGEARQLVQALDDAAPEFARLKAEVEAGIIRPEFDISAYVLDAVNIITAARTVADREGGSIAAQIDQVLADVDLFGASVAPLTRALVQKFYKGGRIASAEKIGGFLNRYAEEARLAGRQGDALAGDPPGPLDVLQAIDRETFGDIEELGTLPDRVEFAGPDGDLPRFEDGAASPEAIEADLVAMDELRRLADTETRSWAGEQPVDTVDALYASAGAAQTRLAATGEAIAARLGIEFRNPGLKDRAEAEAKIERKKYDGPRRLTDISRGGFVVKGLEDGDAVVAELARDFDLIDQGWRISHEGYVDRKVILRHEDGMLSEVQFWTPRMAEAKFGKGTALYEERRALEPSDPRAEALERQMLELYSAATAGDTISAAALRSSVPKVLNQRRNGSSSSTPAVWNTSKASTGSQGPLGRSMATAAREPGSSKSTAGRPSQSQNDNDMEVSPSGEDTPDMGATRAEVNALRAELDDDVSFELEDGTVVSGRQLLDELDADEDLELAIDACLVGGRA